MLKVNDTYIIAVDHGYGNIKTANTIVPSGIHSYSSEPVFTSNVLKYDEKYYRIGEHKKEFIADKALDADYYLFTLVGIANEMSREGIKEGKVHLACGLPLAWVRTQRDTFKKYLLKNKEVEFEYDGERYNVEITGCSIFPQGYPAIVKDIASYQGINMLVDIGNGTMNIMYIHNKLPQEEKCWTEKYGVNQCMIKAKNAISDKFGLQMPEDTIEEIFRTGTADLSSQYQEVIKEVAEGYVEEIFAILRKYEYNKDLVKLHVVGGGSCLVKHFGKFDTSRVEIIDDICASAKGYESLAQVQLSRELKQNQGACGCTKAEEGIGEA